MDAYEQAAEISWRHAHLQAILAGKDPKGFDAVVRAFREHREALLPWLSLEREKAEAELKEEVERFCKSVYEVKPVYGG